MYYFRYYYRYYYKNYYMYYKMKLVSLTKRLVLCCCCCSTGTHTDSKHKACRKLCMIKTTASPMVG